MKKREKNFLINNNYPSGGSFILQKSKAFADNILTLCICFNCDPKWMVKLSSKWGHGSGWELIPESRLELSRTLGDVLVKLKIKIQNIIKVYLNHVAHLLTKHLIID